MSDAPRFRVLPADLAVAAGVAALSVITAWVGAFPDEAPFTPAAAAVLVAGSAVLVFRRWSPVLVWLLVGVAATVYGVVEWSDPLMPFAAFVAVTSVVEYCARPLAVATLIVSSAAAITAMTLPGDADPVDWATIILTLVLAPILGEWLRERRQRLAELAARADAAEREQDRLVAEARLAERRRIARELHDLVTHHVTLLVVQAEAAAAGHPDSRDVLDTLADDGRAALRELRGLLDVLHDGRPGAPAEPTPGIDRIGELVDRSRATGLRVEAAIADLPADLPAPVELAAYRVVQEGLTNVVRHAHASAARVAVCADAANLVVEITDDGTARPGRDGTGLTGLRERVALLGGALDAGPQPAGGFRLQATIPLGSSR